MSRAQEPFRNIGDAIQAAGQQSPGIEAIVHNGHDARTYGQLERRSQRLANSLLGLGLASGDRVAAWIGTCPEYIEVYLAAAKAGLVLVPVNDRYVPDEADFALGDSGASSLIYSASLADRVERLSYDGLRFSASIGGDGSSGTLAFEDLIDKGSEHPIEGPDASAPYVIAYTSGTTGKPKGAVMTHASSLAICRLNSHSYSYQRGGTYVFLGSLAFPSAVVSLTLAQMYLSGRVVVADTSDMEEVVALIGSEGADTVHVPGPFVRDFIAAARARPEALASLVTCLTGGSKIPPDQLRQLWETVGHRYVRCWGMTENSGGGVTATTKNDARGAWRADDFFACSGRPAIDVQLEVIDSDGTPLPHDGRSAGELLYRSPALVDGYWGRPDATEKAFKDGWYHSGDIGFIDAAGYAYIQDRRTDLIVSGGINVYPTEIENVILEMESIAECAVVGVPHPRWGEAVVAVVVPHSGVPPEKDALIRHCRSRLASFKKPTRVIAMDELPRTATGKIQHALVREMVVRGEGFEL